MRQRKRWVWVLHLRAMEDERKLGSAVREGIA
jgi:hypothetical protein